MINGHGGAPRSKLTVYPCKTLNLPNSKHHHNFQYYTMKYTWELRFLAGSFQDSQVLFSFSVIGFCFRESHFQPCSVFASCATTRGKQWSRLNFRLLGNVDRMLTFVPNGSLWVARTNHAVPSRQANDLPFDRQILHREIFWGSSTQILFWSKGRTSFKLVIIL